MTCIEGSGDTVFFKDLSFLIDGILCLVSFVLLSEEGVGLCLFFLFCVHY